MVEMEGYKMKKKFVIAPDSFKGSLNCEEVAAAMKRGLCRAFPEAEIVSLPVADGGEGTMDVIASILPGKKIKRTVSGPLLRPVEAAYFLGSDGTAVVELAQASGITLVEREKLNPFCASTLGTGELLRDALDRGAKKIILTLGGSATNDGGSGIAKALGIRCRKENGIEVEPGCDGLGEAADLDISGIHPGLASTPIEIACDVSNPLCGPEGASAIFGPQKGAALEDIPKLDALLQAYGTLLEQKSGRKLMHLPGTGAAGGAAMPLLAFGKAKIVSGIDTVLRLIGFEKALENADAVLTGEGKIDGQTCFGKAIAGILSYTAPRRIPTLGFAGMLEEGYEALYDKGMTACFAICPGPVKLEDAMKNAGIYLERAVYNVARLMEQLS